MLFLRAAAGSEASKRMERCVQPRENKSTKCPRPDAWTARHEGMNRRVSVGGPSKEKENKPQVNLELQASTGVGGQGPRQRDGSRLCPAAWS